MLCLSRQSTRDFEYGNRSKKNKGKGKQSKKEVAESLKQFETSELSEQPLSGVSSARSSRPPSAAVSPKGTLGPMLGMWEKGEPILSRDKESTGTLGSTNSSRMSQRRTSRRQSRNVLSTPSSSGLAKVPRFLDPPAPPIIPHSTEVNIFDSEPARPVSPLPPDPKERYAAWMRRMGVIQVSELLSFPADKLLPGH